MALSVAPPPAGLRPKLGNFVKSSTGVKGLHHAACTCQSSSTADSGVAGAELSLFLHGHFPPAADRCKNSEETRQFYEDFIGLPMVDALHIKMNGDEDVLHTFFQFDDGSCIAFFDARALPAALALPLLAGPSVLPTRCSRRELPAPAPADRPFDWKEQMDLDLHIAFEVDSDERLQDYLRAAKERGLEVPPVPSLAAACLHHAASSSCLVHRISHS